MSDGANKEMIFQFVQESIRAIPVILLGSGASCACGIPGMGMLGEYLNNRISIIDTFRGEWEKVYSYLGDGLEAALQKANVGDELMNLIIDITAEYIREEDCKLFKKLVLNECELPLVSIIDYIFSGHIQKLNIITTNYDRIVEYSCDLAKIPYTTGFTGGYYKEFSLGRSYDLYQRVVKRKVTSTRMQRFNESIPHVNLLKLHGSVDWFSYNGSIVNIPNNLCIPEYKSLIVAPGLRKYIDTHHNPYREIISASDGSILGGDTFFIVGYGFNDQHLEELLIPKIKDPRIKVVILTMGLSSNAKRILLGTTNTLVITKNELTTGTWCYLNGKEFVFDDNFWEFKNFVNIITGGNATSEHIS